MQQIIVSEALKQALAGLFQYHLPVRRYIRGYGKITKLNLRFQNNKISAFIMPKPNGSRLPHNTYRFAICGRQYPKRSFGRLVTLGAFICDFYFSTPQLTPKYRFSLIVGALIDSFNPHEIFITHRLGLLKNSIHPEQS